MKIGVPKEIHPGEKRVATTPDVVPQLLKLGFTVAVEAGAGSAANFADTAYTEAGAEVVADRQALWAGSDIILKVRGPETDPARGRGRARVAAPGPDADQFSLACAESGFAECPCRRGGHGACDGQCAAHFPRPENGRAQFHGQHRGLSRHRRSLAAFRRFFTGQITAAGKVPPAKVLVIGAGVAGLAAIGAAVSMGAIVRAFDTRPEVKEQVESMGAEFLLLDFAEDGSGEGGYAKVMSEEFIAAEMALFAEQAREVDIIITTALIPGKPAPELITAAMVESMKPGSVIVDLAAEQGGNCELTEADRGAGKAWRHDYRLYRSAQPARGAVQPALCHQPAAPAGRHVSGERRPACGRFRRRGRARRDGGARG